ncbi:hypothetical protein KIL84_001508 [Mauremys mutica]|uniref:Uncharacterized protein n=1 Tax=Mauremys mutica TaxID=74926 RepID=A0A9D3X0Y2_9SAUR|nr:hypothetical protein KIL84_001508 [Mauremys mutica]
MTLRFMHGKCIIVHVFIQLCQKGKKKKMQHFQVSLSPQHMKTILNFIVAFISDVIISKIFCLFPHYLISALFFGHLWSSSIYSIKVGKNEAKIEYCTLLTRNSIFAKLNVVF